MQKLKCDQENNNQSELDKCLIDEGLKNNGDSTFCDEKTVEVMRHQDPVGSSSTDTDSDTENDAEQDALSLQLQEILFWTQPLPPQLSPLPYPSPSGKASVNKCCTLLENNFIHYQIIPIAITYNLLDH